ncbi:hypothetical protein ARMA_2468 [Ardenticatena maritima]|uniref:Uncharacterized protein n=1 Tax=Ardenticatena maritima TaxID=872965 RepID=A0A0M8K8Q2_9CHLR|nr:hypothetical protein ARMA_2468 [Ardenticatena maritima]
MLDPFGCFSSCHGWLLSCLHVLLAYLGTFSAYHMTCVCQSDATRNALWFEQTVGNVPMRAAKGDHRFLDKRREVRYLYCAYI